jgi:hypothetical protein
VLGVSNTEAARSLGDTLIAAVKGDALDPRSGVRFTWGQLVGKLLNGASDAREARDNFRELGDDYAAEQAEKLRAAIMGVYNNLAELYRTWPDLGLDEQGRLRGLPAGLLTVAVVIGGASIWWWAVSQAVAAATMLATSIREWSACSDDPGSRACEQATLAAGKAAKAYEEGGKVDLGGFSRTHPRTPPPI